MQNRTKVNDLDHDFRENWKDLWNEQPWPNLIERLKSTDWKNWILGELHQEQVWYCRSERRHLVQSYKAINLSQDIQEAENILVTRPGENLTVRLSKLICMPYESGCRCSKLFKGVNRTTGEQASRIHKTEKQVFQFFKLFQRFK